MPLTGHLAELRARLIKVVIALTLAFVVSYAFVDHLFALLAAPLLEIQVPGLTLIGTAVTEAFFTQIKVAFIAAVFLAMPVILWQSWQFVGPGLYEHEKYFARRFVFWGTFFFLLGAWFCYEVVFRIGYAFLLERYQMIGVRPAIRLVEYLSFSSRLLLAFGVTFELPVVTYFLARIGLIDHRTLIRHFRYAFLGIFVLAAILTPPDIISQLLLSGPLLLLYGISIGVAYLASRKTD